MKKKTWKKLLSSILAIAMVLGMAAVDGANAFATEVTQDLTGGIEAIADEETATSVEIDRTAMTAEAGDYEPNGGASEGPAELAIDGDRNTIWHTKWDEGENHDNHWLMLILNEAQLVDGFKYLRRQGGGNGSITQYKIQTSMDKETWNDVAEGTWADSDEWKVVSFAPVEAKYVKLVTLAAKSDQSLKFASAAEVRVTTPASAQEELTAAFAQEYAAVGEELSLILTGAENADYVWTVDGKEVSTEASYTPTADDLESFIEVTVTAGSQSVTAKMYFSKLPVVYINTHDGKDITSKTDYKDADLKIQGNAEFNSETTTLYDGLTEIRGRGNSTWGMPKKPYKLKLDKKTDLLGMGNNKHWVLLANYSDESLMRNTLAYNFSGDLGMEQMSTEWVTVIFNGRYDGNYQLCEQVRVDDTRVDVFDWEGFAEDSADIIADAEGLDKSAKSDLEEYMLENMEWITSGKVVFNGVTYTIADYSEIEIPSINGGYLLELDEYYDEVSKFKTEANQPVMFKNPEFVATNEDMIGFVQEYVQAFEDAVKSGEYTAEYDGKTTHYSELYDFDALVDYWLINEIFFNEELNKKSTYMYKEIDELMKMGPIWDMDYSSGGEGQTYHTEQWATLYYSTNAQANQWYKDLIKDPYFLMKAQERYWEIRDAQVADMLQELEDSYELLKESAKANGERWSYGSSFESYVDSLRNWFNKHLTWLDAQMKTEDSLKVSLKYNADSNLVLALKNEKGNALTADTSENVPADYVLADGEDITLTVTGGTADVYVNSQKVAEDVAAGTAVTIKAEDLTAEIGEKDIIEVKSAKSSNFVTVKSVDDVQTNDSFEVVESELPKAGSIAATDESVTEDQPLAAYTGESKNFRIPALITLKNGDILAAADARWTTTSDAMGLDTIASVSSDGGKTWNYSFPIYFPDSDTTTPPMGVATTVIDPALVQGPDGAIYCIADVNPSGITTLDIWPGQGTGYVEIEGTQRLVLTDTYVKPSGKNWSTYGDPNNAETYKYYVGDFNSQGYAKILKRADHTETDWAVDEWFNLYKLNEEGKYTALEQTQVDSETKIQQNLFYKDSELHVYSTGYILYSKSYDNGRTWVEPTIITTQIKRENETALLVSPGQGMVTSDGDIIIPFYNNTVIGGDSLEHASFIWSSDNGKTWTRSNNVGVLASSESEIVELNNGTLRMFFRNTTGNICYADAEKVDGVWTMGQGKSTGISVTSTCNVTAIRHSQTVDGKLVIIVGCPANGGSRADGSLFTFLVDEDNSMELYNEYKFNEGYYAYSCLTELKNGNLGLLWEDSWSNASGTIRYDEVDLDYTLGLIKDISIPAGQSYTEENADGKAYDIKEGYDKEIVNVTTETVNLGSTTLLRDHTGAAKENSVAETFNAESNPNLNLETAVFTMQASGEYWHIYNEATNQYLTNASSANTFFSASAGDMIIEKIGDDFQIRKSNNTRPVFFYKPEMNFNANSAYVAGSEYQLTLLEKQDVISNDDVVPGYRAASEVKDGGKYLISYIYEDGVIVLYPTNGTYNQTKAVGTTEVVVKNILTMEGLKKGTTVVAVGDVTYNVTVRSAEIPVDKLTATAEDYETSGGASEGPADLVLDGDTSTIWHTEWNPAPGAGRDTHWIQLAIDGDYLVDGLRYLPRQSGPNGIITEYKIVVSTDGKEWTEAATGKWEANTAWKVVEFDAPVYAKYVRLYSLNSDGDQTGNAFASAAEIRLTGTATTAPEPPVCDHANTEVVDKKDATCTEEGYTGDIICADCGTELKKGEVIEKLAHTPEAVAGKEATCTETGLTEGSKCSVCGEVLKEQETTAALGHTWSEWTVVKEATTEEAGMKERTCSVCSEKDTEVIPKLEDKPEQKPEDKPEQKPEDKPEQKPEDKPSAPVTGDTAPIFVWMMVAFAMAVSAVYTVFKKRNR